MSITSQDHLDGASHVSHRLTSLLYALGSRIVLPLYFGQIHVRGKEHLPETGPVLIAPTHRSRWDGVVIGHCLGRPATGRDPRYMVSVNEMSGLQGWLIRQFGGFAVDPDAPSISVLRHGIDLLLKDQALVIFGEGDIFHKRKVNHIKPGLARIALQAQKKANHKRLGTSIQVLPVGLYYSDVYPSKGSSVDIRFGPTLDVNEYLERPAKTAATQLTHDLKASLNHLMEQDLPLELIPAQVL